MGLTRNPMQELQAESDRLNAIESLERINTLLELENERELARQEAELRSSPYRPDETDDQWATDWENDFELSAQEWERWN